MADIFKLNVLAQTVQGKTAQQQVSNTQSHVQAQVKAQSPAQTKTGTKTSVPGMNTKGGKVPATKNPNNNSAIIMMVLMFIVVYFIMFRGPKKKQQQHKQMLDNLKKGDKVRTIGGILATVVDVRDDEVVIKVDETSNVKMKVVRAAIGTVIDNNASKK